MPYVGGDVLPACKRRRSDDDDDDFYSPNKQRGVYEVNQHPGFAARKILPLSKRARVTHDDEDDDGAVHSVYHSELMSPQRRWLSEQKGTHDQAAFSVRARASGSILAPCHICHRKPTKKSDLDSFAECQSCDERTCFVCIRECPGWLAADEEEEALSRSFHMDDADNISPTTPHEEGSTNPDRGFFADHRGGSHSAHHSEHNGERTGRRWDHRNVVCSRCCVEKGAEGEVVCLGCLSGMEGA